KLDSQFRSFRMGGHGMKLVRHVNERLRRNAAADQTGAAQLARFHQHGIKAQLPGADGGHIAARAAAHHQDFASDLFHEIYSMNSMAGCSSSAFMTCTSSAASAPSTIR